MATGSILVLYGGGREADAMLHLACRAAGTRCGVIALYVTRIATSLPLEPLPDWMDQAGEEALNHAEAIAHQYGTELDTRLTRARRPIDAILMFARAGELQAVFLPYVFVGQTVASAARGPYRLGGAPSRSLPSIGRGMGIPP